MTHKLLEDIDDIGYRSYSLSGYNYLDRLISGLGSPAAPWC